VNETTTTTGAAWTDPDPREWDDPGRQRDYLAEWITPETVIYTRQTHGSGETDYIEVYAVRGGEVAVITWQVARAAGLRVRDFQGRRMIPMGGGGYSKGLEVYLALRLALGQDECQRYWQEV